MCVSVCVCLCLCLCVVGCVWKKERIQMDLYFFFPFLGEFWLVNT